MIPIKDKKYMINCQGPFEYNRYMGEGVFKGEIESVDDETCYGFKIPGTTEICFFTREEIVAEFTDDNQVRSSICDPENYPEDEESPYCEKCGSCGEEGCCTPAKCEAVKCKYGERCVEDYERMSKQWDIMFKTLESISNNYETSDGIGIGLMLRAKHALDEINESW
jgi:hypothetical protein